MPDVAAVDSDVLLKTAAYRLATELVEVLQTKGAPAVLGLTHLIADKQLKGLLGLRDLEGAQAELKICLMTMGRLEPDEGEISLAADLAAEAQKRGVALDTGEAQLAAIVARRQLPLLATGDKRALCALASLVEDGPIRTALSGRLVCFEQIMAAVAIGIGALRLRLLVCAEPDIDGAMRLACSCGRDPWDANQLLKACKSFSENVREQVGDLLVDGSMLT